MILHSLLCFAYLEPQCQLCQQRLLTASKALHRYTQLWLSDLSSAFQTCSHQNMMCVLAATCSQYGVCLTTVSTTTTNTAPTITLRTTTALPATVNVKQYSTYAACASGVTPTTALLCELGATATDTQDGTLTSVVNTCAPSTCTSTSTCSGRALGCLSHDLCKRQTCLSDCQLCPSQACCVLHLWAFCICHGSVAAGSVTADSVIQLLTAA